MTRTRDQIRANLTDANVIATLGPAALTAMTAALGGYPSSTPGAAPAGPSAPPEYSGKCKEQPCPRTRPCPEHDSAIALTQPERLASTNDPAARALAQFTKDIAIAQKHLANAARAATRWGMPGINSTGVKERLLAIDEGVWCTNCSRYGHHNAREENKSLCWYCGDFKAKYGMDCPRIIHQARDARGGTLSSTDILRLLDRDFPDWRKKKKRRGGKAA